MQNQSLKYAEPELTAQLHDRSEVNWRRLPLEARAVVQENVRMLTRRWQIANDPWHPANTSPRAMDEFFPGQRRLFEVLSLITLEKAQEIARTKSPLFHLPVTRAISGDSINFQSTLTPPQPGNDAERYDEVLDAITTRLDQLRLNRVLAQQTYSITEQEASFLSRHCSSELRALAADQNSVLRVAASDQFFIYAAFTQDVDWRTRTQFSRSSRAVALH